MFLTEDGSLDGVKTLIKISVRYLNLVDLCNGVGIVWSTTTRTRVSDATATAVTSSVKCLIHSNSILCQETSSESGLLHTFLIYSRVFNNIMISNGKSFCCNDTFTDVRLTSLLAKNI